MVYITYDNIVFTTIKDFYRHIKSKYQVKVSYSFVCLALRCRRLTPDEVVKEIINKDDTMIFYGRKKFNSVKSLYSFLNMFDKINSSYNTFLRDYSNLSTENFREKYNLDRKLKQNNINTNDVIKFVKSIKSNRFIVTKMASQEFLKNL